MQLGVVFLEVQSRLFYEAWSCIGSGFVRGFTSQESRKPCRYPAGFKPRFFTFKGNWIAKVAFHSYCIWQLSISILENSCHALDYSGHMGVLSIINCDTICIGIANEQFGILADCELKLVSNWQIVGCTVAAPSHLLHCNTAHLTNTELVTRLNSRQRTNHTITHCQQYSPLPLQWTGSYICSCDRVDCCETSRSMRILHFTTSTDGT